MTTINENLKDVIKEVDLEKEYNGNTSIPIEVINFLKVEGFEVGTISNYIAKHKSPHISLSLDELRESKYIIFNKQIELENGSALELTVYENKIEYALVSIEIKKELKTVTAIREALIFESPEKFKELYEKILKNVVKTVKKKDKKKKDKDKKKKNKKKKDK